MRLTPVNNISIVQNSPRKKTTNNTKNTNGLEECNYANIPSLHSYNNFKINKNLSFKGSSNNALLESARLKMTKYCSEVISKWSEEERLLRPSADTLSEAVLKTLSKEGTSGLSSIATVASSVPDFFPGLKTFDGELYSNLVNTVVELLDDPSQARDARSALSLVGDFSHLDILLSSLEKDRPYLSSKDDSEIKNVVRLMKKTDDQDKLFSYIGKQNLSSELAALTVISDRGGEKEAQKLSSIVDKRIIQRREINIGNQELAIALCKIATAEQADLVAEFIHPKFQSSLTDRSMHELRTNAINSIGRIGNDSHTDKLFTELNYEIEKEKPRIGEKFREDAPLTNLIITAIGRTSTNILDAKKLASIHKENPEILDLQTVQEAITNIVAN